MERAEIERRDRVIRAYIVGRDWDRNDEFLLKRALVLRSAELLPGFPFLVDDEWDVEPGKSDEGKGDLVFADGYGRFAVVEVKFIDNSRSGKTARVKRTKSRKLVVEQAEKYARIIASREAVLEVSAFAYTSDAPERLVRVPVDEFG